ncbi:hypothetical protein C1H46_011739 [Malus baccata]|uniref:Uncharacterized protein n=1 Tax=Malus baccata TaxID=106549 RepID=A0A540MWE1_MALBA|nr:hypothetical protein C1H46_011739 [Malus baccata]
MVQKCSKNKKEPATEWLKQAAPATEWLNLSTVPALTLYHSGAVFSELSISTYQMKG